jgi:hypothetical protein
MLLLPEVPHSSVTQASGIAHQTNGTGFCLNLALWSCLIGSHRDAFGSVFDLRAIDFLTFKLCKQPFKH